ncbi:MAG: universal stress protein [Deltaproteobacteria bacterium]|nr:universal stress protein [Deltaproteobacteria bacterium]
MENVNKIMVALAFSLHSEGIFNYAAQIANLLNAELIIASIINSRDISAVGMVASMGYEVDSEHYVEGVKAERKKMLDHFMEKSSLDRKNIRTIFTVGYPIEELLKLIVKENIDIIVMGVKGRTDLEHVFIGSVAEKLFRRSPVPVISFRDEKSAERLRKKIILT